MTRVFVIRVHQERKEEEIGGVYLHYFNLKFDSFQRARLLESTL